MLALKPPRKLRITILTSFIAISSVCAPVQADGPIQAKLTTWMKGHGKRPNTARDGRLEELATNVDWLEHHVNQWGSVSAKAPDVWGEARLTDYRFEVEKSLGGYINGFKPDQINGAQSVSDSAMLAAALSIQAKGPVGPGQTAIPAPAIQIQSTTNGGGSAGATSSITLPNDFTPPNSRFTFNEQSKEFLGKTLGLEQTQVLDELNRYLQHLNQLRRINEGDDTADAPGYALNLIRIPVSILPGTLTKRGYGAEITMTAKPYLGPELLPMTFRDLVTNDLIDQLAIPLSKFLNSNPNRADRLLYAYQVMQRRPQLLEELNRRYYNQKLPLNEATLNAIVQLGDQLRFLKDGILRLPICTGEDVESVCYEIELVATQVVAGDGEIAAALNAPQMESGQAALAEVSKRFGMKEKIPDRAVIVSDFAKVVKQGIGRQLSEVFAVVEDLGKAEQFLSSVCAISITSSSSRRSQLPFPPTQIIDVFGSDEMTRLALAALSGFREDLPNKRVVHVSDCKSFLREEVSAAFSLLYSETMREWWASESTGQRLLHDLIRMHRTAQIAEYRQRFIDFVQANGRSDITAGLAWCAFVDSILLNERLIDDIRETAGNRPGNLSLEPWIAFYGPDPCMEARQLFADYAAHRWPLRVFAIDPTVEQQNIGDFSSVYRQMQLAVVLGVSGGDVGISTAMNTLRKLQRDRATIDLNRTVVGFGQGDNTFGWRFRPRFQTPPVEGNAKVFFRDLIVGGPTDKQLERGLEIEPGMRECTAVVLMPSFVPYVTIETRSQWYKLNAPGHVAHSIKDDVEMSRAIQSMKMRANECSLCTHLYRDGEVERVLSRVEQLEKRLPMQSIACQVPTENAHGGFEILSSGTRALAPELLGWYGSPGYDRSKGSSFFMSGDNFSIKQTNLIVGNQVIPSENIRMLSRQIIQVILPANLPILTDTLLTQHDPARTFRQDPDRGIERDTLYDGYIDAHIATPYGVSSHLLIPAVQIPAPSPTQTPCSPVRFSTVGKEFPIKVTLKDKPKQLVDIERLDPIALWLPSIQLPKTIGMSATPRDVQLFLEHSGNRFGPIEFQDVRYDERQSGYQIGTDDLLTQLKPTGNLFKLIENYANYLQANGANAMPLCFDASYTIQNGSTEVPVDGDFKVKTMVP